MPKPKKKLYKRDLSVALSSGSDEKKSPTVCATGIGEFAKKIEKIARDHDIPIVENEELARDLSMLEVGSQLPEELFPVVAEIIAHIYHVSETYKNYGRESSSAKL